MIIIGKWNSIIIDSFFYKWNKTESSSTFHKKYVFWISRYDISVKDENIGDPYMTHDEVNESDYDDYFSYNKQIESLKQQLDSKEVINALSNQSVSI